VSDATMFNRISTARSPHPDPSLLPVAGVPGCKSVYTM